MLVTAIALIDPDLVVPLTRDALACFDRLLGTVPPGDTLPAGEIGAMVRVLSTVASAKPAEDQ